MTDFNNKVDDFLFGNKINIHTDIVDGITLVYFKNWDTKEISDIYAPLWVNDENYGLRTRLTEKNTYESATKYLARQIKKTIEYLKSKENR